MKALIATLILFSACAANAEKTICDRFMKCGTFVAQDEQRNVETKITIKGTGPYTGTFDYTLTDKDGKTGTWPLVAKFSKDGHGVLYWKGKRLYAVTICKHGMCNYALVPFKDEEHGIWGNAGLMRFTDNTLEFMMTVGTPTENKSRGFVMNKQ